MAQILAVSKLDERRPIIEVSENKGHVIRRQSLKRSRVSFKKIFVYLSLITFIYYVGVPSDAASDDQKKVEHVSKDYCEWKMSNGRDGGGQFLGPFISKALQMSASSKEKVCLLSCTFAFVLAVTLES